MDLALDQHGELHLTVRRMSSLFLRLSFTLLCLMLVRKSIYKYCSQSMFSRQHVFSESNSSVAKTSAMKQHQSSREDAQKLLKKASFNPNTMPNRPNNDPKAVATFGGLIRDLRTIRFRDVETLLTMFIAKQKGVQNDQKLLLERMIELLSKLMPDQGLSQKLTGGFVHTLWDERQHPNLTTLDERYRYRSADGSHNNILMPDLVSNLLPSL